MDNFNDISPQGYQSPLIPMQSPNQLKADEKDREETLAQLPLLKKIVERLTDRIALTDSIRESRRIATSHNIPREAAEVALLELNKMLEAERKFIQARIDRLK